MTVAGRIFDQANVSRGAILLVEDDRSVARFIEIELVQAGYQVIVSLTK